MRLANDVQILTAGTEILNVTKQQARTAGALSAQVQLVASRLSEIFPDTYQVCFISYMAIKWDDTPQQWFTDTNIFSCCCCCCTQRCPAPLWICWIIHHAPATACEPLQRHSDTHPPTKKKSLNCARVRELQTKQSVGFHRRGAFKVGPGLSQVGLCSTSAKDKQETDDDSEVLSSWPKSIPIDKPKNGQQGFF